MVVDGLNDGFLDSKVLKRIEELLPEENILRGIAGFYSIFSDSTRIKIISALAINELCVGDIATLLEINQSTVSHQLKLLKNLGIVDYRREGKLVFYFVKSFLIDEVMSLGLEHLRSAVSFNI